MELVTSRLSSSLLRSHGLLEGSQESHHRPVLADLPGLQWVKADDNPYQV